MTDTPQISKDNKIAIINLLANGIKQIEVSRIFNLSASSINRFATINKLAIQEKNTNLKLDTLGEKSLKKAIVKLNSLVDSQDEGIALASSKEILDRIKGKSIQRNANVNISKHLSKEDLKELLQADTAEAFSKFVDSKIKK